MAAVKTEATAKLVLNVQTGTTASGAASYSQRTFGDINPELSVDDAYAIGTALAGLQTYPLGSISRTDNAVLIENA